MLFGPWAADTPSGQHPYLQAEGRRAAAIPDLPGSIGTGCTLQEAPREGNASLLRPIYFQLPASVTGAEEATSPQRT